MMMIDVDPKMKKKKGAESFERPEDLDDEWVKQHQDALVEEQRQKITKKFEKDNEKLKSEGAKEMKEKELKERLEVADELAAKFKRENKTGKVEAEGKGPTVEKLNSAVEKLEQRIETMKLQMEDKEGNKEVALGTSKIVSGVTFLRSKYRALTWYVAELYRSPSHRGLLEEVQRPD
jgi:DNA topoisomerase-1